MRRRFLDQHVCFVSILESIQLHLQVSWRHARIVIVMFLRERTQMTVTAPDHLSYYACTSMQIIQVTDPALIAEACRSKDLDRTNPGNRALSIFAGPHGYPTLLTGPSDARWKVVRQALTRTLIILTVQLGRSSIDQYLQHDGGCPKGMRITRGTSSASWYLQEVRGQRLQHQQHEGAVPKHTPGLRPARRCPEVPQRRHCC